MTTSANIFVSDLWLKARVGVNPGELEAEQPIVVDVWVGIEDITLPAHSEDLRDTMDYEGIARAVRQVVHRRHYPLVETLASAIAEGVLAQPGANWVRIRLRKLNCLRDASAAGVEVELSLDELQSQPEPVLLDQVVVPEEIVIIGGGVTGLTSALWCWRLGHPALLIDSAPLLGGQLHLAHGLMIDLPAMNPMTGPSLARRLWRQFMQHNGRWLRAELKHLEADASGCNLFLQGTTSAGEQWEKTLRARTAIISTGVRRKNLEVPGEKKFYGRGILHTAAKGRKFLNGKMVAVIGGGDSACENALLLTQAGARVTLIHHGPRLSARHQFAHEIQHHSGITLRLDTQVRGFMGSEALESLSLEHQGREEVLPVQAALIRVGWVPNSEMLPGHWLDPRGYVKANPTGEITGQTSVFAAGDILGQLAPSVTTAFGGGAIAARAAVAFLESD